MVSFSRGLRASDRAFFAVSWGLVFLDSLVTAASGTAREYCMCITRSSIADQFFDSPLLGFGLQFSFDDVEGPSLNPTLCNLLNS